MPPGHGAATKTAKKWRKLAIGRDEEEKDSTPA